MKAAIAIVLLASCATPTADPRLASIEPAIITSLVETPAEVHGLDLDAMVHLDLDSTAATIDRGWRVRIAGVPVTTTWHDRAQLDVVIPRGFAAGVHDVAAISPDGRELILPAALTVTVEPVGLRLVIEDARGGTGSPISGVRTAGDQGEAYAVVRDPAGTFVTDLAVAWGTTGPFARVTPSGDHVMFEARTVGAGQLTAHHAGAALDSESGVLTTIAGPAARIVIADAPAPTGMVIGDRSGLTTDTDGGLTAYVVAVDAFDNVTGDVTAAWTLTGVTGSMIGSALDFTTPGTGQLHATHAVLGTTSTGTLTVAAGRAASLAISPAALATTADAAPIPFSATALDGDGNTTGNLGTLTWSIASGPITTLDPTTGVLDPVRAGTGTVAVASSWGATAQSQPIVIAPGSASAIAIAPVVLAIFADEPPVTFTATVLDADSNALPGTASWSIASGSITAIDPVTGAFDPRVAGSGMVAASLGGVTASVPVTVLPGRAATLAITPGLLDIVAGEPAVPFSASGNDADGNVTPDLGTLAWTIASGPISMINTTTGMLTPIAAGTGVIRATSSYGASGDSGTVRIRGAAALTAVLAAPAQVVVGGGFTIAMTTTNVGGNAAAAITPCALVLGGSGGATITAAPSTVPMLGAGGSTISTWSLTATAEGALTFTTCATAIDATTSAATTTAAVGTSSTIVPDDRAYVVASDPFGDGSRFGFVTGYRDQIYLGPNATGTSAVRFASPSSTPEPLSFLFARDGTGHKADNTSTAPYTSIGSLGCSEDTASCGPDNESQRGMFRSVVVSGIDWLIASGTSATKNERYLYMTTDADPTLDFRYVDLTGLLSDAHGVSALAGVGDRMYIGLAGDRSKLLALTTMPFAPGLDAVQADAPDMRFDRLSGWDNGNDPKNVDAIAGVGGLAYVANKNLWVRATVSSPGPVISGCLPLLCTQPWVDITPSAAAYAARPSYETLKTGGLEPADRAVVEIVEFGDRIFVARNTTSGPQLWSCRPIASKCDAGDWRLVAANSTGDTLLTQFNDPSLTSVSMLVATASYLYVGFDSAAGIRVFRTTVPAAVTRADFETFGTPGLDTPANTRIFDAKAITASGTTAVWLTTGNLTSPLSLMVIP